LDGRPSKIPPGFAGGIEKRRPDWDIASPELKAV
jgi:hypothetical protein